MGIDMAFIGELVEGVEDSAATSPLIVLAVAHLRCDGVGSLEADAPDVIGKAVGILLHLVDALLAVSLIDLSCEGGADTVALEKDHHVLDVELLHPRVVNLLDALGANAVHLAEPLAVFLDDVEGVHAELGDNELGELWTDTLDKSAAKVLLQSEERGGHGFLVALYDELAAVLSVDLPLAVGDEYGAHGHVEHVADQGDEVVIPLHPCLQYRIAVLAILIRNPLYDRAQLHYDFTKVQSFGENIAKYIKKPVPSVDKLTIPARYK